MPHTWCWAWSVGEGVIGTGGAVPSVMVQLWLNMLPMGKRICVNSNKVSVGVISLLSSLLGIRIRIFNLPHASASVHRLCVHVIIMQVQVRRAWHVLCLLLEKLFGVCSIQAAMAPTRHHPRPPSPLPKNAIVRDQL